MADKKLLEESTIRRFMQLANIKPTEQGVLTEGMKAGGAKDSDKAKFAGDSDTKGERRNPHGLREEEDQEKMEEAYHEEGYGSDMNEADEEGGEDMADAGDEMGAEAEGGDLESAVEQLVSAMNGVLAAAGMSDKTVELDSGEGEEGGMEDMGAEDEGTMMEADDLEEVTDRVKDLGDRLDKHEKNPRTVKKLKRKGKAAMRDPQNMPWSHDEEGKVEYADYEDKFNEGLEESIELVDDTLVEKLLQRVSARLVAEARKSRELAEGKGGKGWGKSGMHASAAKSKSSTKGHGPKGKSGTPFTKKMSTKGLANR